MEIKTRMENEMLHAVATGAFTLQDSKQIFVQLLNAVKEFRASRVLMDGSSITGEPTTMERFQYGEFCAGEINKMASSQFLLPRVAYVLNYPVLDPGRFGETVAVNRGVKMRAFDNITDARAWLEEAG